MITAREAITLPSARVSDSDAEAAAALLRDVEAHVRANMTRNGCVVPVDPRRLNAVIAVEVERACRLAGWHAEFQQRVERSALANGQPVVSGYQLALTVPDEAYAPLSALAAS